MTRPESDLVRYAKLMECTKRGQQYPIAPYFKASAPHGPSRDCRGTEWEPVRVRIEDKHAV